MKPIYRAYRINHHKFNNDRPTVTVIGDFDKKEDADEALWLDQSDEPSPDKNLFYSWHVDSISPTLRKNWRKK
jgi:hypothetical protein